MNAPTPEDPYRDCAVYLEHGECVCSTGYPASCQMTDLSLPSWVGETAEQSERRAPASRTSVTSKPVNTGLLGQT